MFTDYFFLRVCVDGKSDKIVPVDARSCVVPRKCKVSHWSEWKVDSEDCQDSHRLLMNRLVRAREVERLPQNGGKPCPHLKEYKLAQEDQTLFSAPIDKDLSITSLNSIKSSPINSSTTSFGIGCKNR